MTKECVSALLGDSVLAGASDRLYVSGAKGSVSTLTDDTSESLTNTCKYSELAELC